MKGVTRIVIGDVRDQASPALHQRVSCRRVIKPCSPLMQVLTGATFKGYIERSFGGSRNAKTSSTGPMADSVDAKAARHGMKDAPYDTLKAPEQ